MMPGAGAQVFPVIWRKQALTASPEAEDTRSGQDIPLV